MTEVPVPITYRALTIPTAYRMDVLVEDVVVVETKAVSRVTEAYEAQLLSHLRLSRRTVGLLINFHVRHLRHGIKRMVNNYKGSELKTHNDFFRSPQALPRRASALNMV